MECGEEVKQALANVFIVLLSFAVIRHLEFPHACLSK